MFQEALLEPVADVLDDLARKEGPNFRGVFLHVMSNGMSSLHLQTLRISRLIGHHLYSLTRWRYAALDSFEGPCKEGANLL